MNKNHTTPTIAPGSSQVIPRRSTRIAAAASSIPLVRNSNTATTMGTFSSSNSNGAPVTGPTTRRNVEISAIPAGANSSLRKKTQDVGVSHVAHTLAKIKIDNNHSNQHYTTSSKVASTTILKTSSSSLSRSQQDFDSNNNVGLEASLSSNLTSTSKTLETMLKTTTADDTAASGGEILKNFEADNCKFCYVNLRAYDGVMLQDCLHIFCRDCLQAAIELQTEAVKIPCPVSEEHKCGGYLTDSEVKALVRPDIFQEYLDRSLVIAKKKIKNVFNCTTPGCSSWCEFEEGRKIFICPQCKQTNCMECNAIHTGVDCFTFMSLAQKGQLSKVKELMEKETKNGWEQFTAIMNASGKSQYSVLAENDLLHSTMEFECSICYTDVFPGEGVILHECLHLFCKNCLVNLVEHNDETTVKCPYIDGNYSCVNFMQPREIKALVPQATYDKHLQRLLKLGESSIENSFHCKTPDCNGWCVFEDGDRVFMCPICNKPNCIACNAIHSGSCADYKNRLTQNENDKLSEDAVEKLIKKGEYMRCPKCKIPVQKTVGCDWIQCSACRTEICWVTRGPRWGPKGHGDITGGCRCKVNGKKCHPKCGNCH